MRYELHHGDCLDILPEMEAASIDTIITDPPYGLSFMGKDWDHGVPGARFWREALRVAKPGAMLLAFGGTRTHHRLMVAIEDAGWEIRDVIMWVYGSGFPKSHDISKAIDKAAGAEREVVGHKGGRYAYAFTETTGAPMGNISPRENSPNNKANSGNITAPATDAAREWHGYGTALKPANERIIIAQKPLPESAEHDIIVGNLYILEAQLWLLLHATTAESDSTLSQAEKKEAFAIAQWSADSLISILEDLRGLTDTSRLKLAIHTSLSTVSSWRRIWEEALKHGSTFITETVTSQIIDLATLSCSALALTPQNIIRAAIGQPGLWFNALPAARILNAAAMNLSATLERFAVESAIEQGHIARPEGADQTILDRTIIVAMKPLDGTFANNALTWGVAGLWIDGGRIPANGDVMRRANNVTIGGNGIYQGGKSATTGAIDGRRWPANLIHDGSDEVLAGFPVTGASKATRRGELVDNRRNNYNRANGARIAGSDSIRGHDDNGGSAARFFYCAKASRSERNAGLEGLPERDVGYSGRHTMSGDMPYNYTAKDGIGRTLPRQNHHPTVKPLALMRYLARITRTPSGGVVLDPFMGSGSTGVASLLEGRPFVGIELDADYIEIARRRLEHAASKPVQPALFSNGAHQP